MANLDVSVLYPSEYVKADDLKNKPVLVTITKIVRDKVPMSGGVTEACTVVHFKGTDKKLIAGKTNGYALAVLFGSDLSCAVGKRVTLTPDTDTFGKDRVPCIRILGSPDAPEDRAAAYARAWRGKRERGALVSRLKRVLATLSHVTPPPVDEIEENVEDVDANDIAEEKSDEVFCDAEKSQREPGEN